MCSLNVLSNITFYSIFILATYSPKNHSGCDSLNEMYNVITPDIAIFPLCVCGAQFCVYVLLSFQFPLVSALHVNITFSHHNIEYSVSEKQTSDNG